MYEYFNIFTKIYFDVIYLLNLFIYAFSQEFLKGTIQKYDNLNKKNVEHPISIKQCDQNSKNNLELYKPNKKYKRILTVRSPNSSLSASDNTHSNENNSTHKHTGANKEDLIKIFNNFSSGVDDYVLDEEIANITLSMENGTENQAVEGRASVQSIQESIPQSEDGDSNKSRDIFEDVIDSTPVKPAR